jgi:hypothetical protein
MKRNTNKLSCDTSESNEIKSIDLMKSDQKRKNSKTSASSDSPKSGGNRSPVKKSTKISDRSPTKKKVDHMKQLDGIEKPYSDISDVGAAKLPHIVSNPFNFIFSNSLKPKFKNLWSQRIYQKLKGSKFSCKKRTKINSRIFSTILKRYF